MPIKDYPIIALEFSNPETGRTDLYSVIHDNIAEINCTDYEPTLSRFFSEYSDGEDFSIHICVVSII